MIGITDPADMGAAMAPAAYDTLSNFFAETGETPENFDLILTGDLGRYGRDIVIELFQRDSLNIAGRYDDCGAMIFDSAKQDTHAGGSGCGCSAVTLCGHILNGMCIGQWNRILFAGTGALLSPTSQLQGESIPGICHAVVMQNAKCRMQN